MTKIFKIACIGSVITCCVQTFLIALWIDLQNSASSTMFSWALMNMGLTNPFFYIMAKKQNNNN